MRAAIDKLSMTVTRFALASYNNLSFQQHSRLIGLSTFLFTNIPASRPGFPQRSFVFNNIPALLVQKKNSFSIAGRCQEMMVDRRRLPTNHFP
jgi:hypothetical protein